ncbi:MAG TPA: hypothetical protein VIA29_02355 [Thermoanaerobaculia bacterium]|jgi:hypothetical protein
MRFAFVQDFDVSSNPIHQRFNLRGLLLLAGLVAVAALEIWAISAAIDALR